MHMDRYDEPKVSVILPTYNHLRFLPPAIDSVLGQDFQDFELVIVNDGSTDGTKEYLDGLDDPRIRVVHQENRRLPEALNAGFQVAQGEMLTWISADNHCAPGFLGHLAGALEAYPEAGFAYSAFANIDADGNAISIRENQSLTYHDILVGNPGVASFMYRRTCQDKVGYYDASVECAEDWDYWVRILEHFETVYVPQVLYHYRRHGDTMSQRMPEEVRRASRKVFDNAMRRRNYDVDLIGLYPAIRLCRDKEMARFHAGLDFGARLLRSPFADLAVAIKVFAQMRREKIGDLHVASNLAVAYARLGRWDQTLPLLREMMGHTKDQRVLEVCRAIINAQRADDSQLLRDVTVFSPDRERSELFQIEARNQRVFQPDQWPGAKEPRATSSADAQAGRPEKERPAHSNEWNITTPHGNADAPHQERIDVVCSTRKLKITIVVDGNGRSFMEDFIAHWRAFHDVRILDNGSQEAIAEALMTADVVWFEWATDAVARATRLPRRCRSIVRLHSYEAFTAFPEHINWSNVDDLVFVSSHIRNVLSERFPDVEKHTRMHVIPNCVDLTRFYFKDKPFGKRIAFVGALRPAKNIPLLLECFREIHAVDPEYSLHVAGELFGAPVHQGELFYYIKHTLKELGIKDSTFFEGRVADISSWLDDKDFILSTSIREGHPVNVVEGMAKGLKPIIHNFPGAKSLYPSAWIFNTAQECRDIVLGANRNRGDYRAYVQKRWSREVVLPQIDALLGVAVGHPRGGENDPTHVEPLPHLSAERDGETSVCSPGGSESASCAPGECLSPSLPVIPESAAAAGAAEPPMSVEQPVAQSDGAEASDEQYMQSLIKLERQCQAMPEASPARRGLAIRLSELYRRAGLRDKSRTWEQERPAQKAMSHPSLEQSKTPDTCSTREMYDGPPKVAVITGCRNAEKWLRECLDSILNQTMPQWQLFLLDDGSTDGTRRIIEEYAGRDRRITPFYFDDNAGPYVRRNYLIARATTPFVMVHDADDIMCPEKVQRLYEAISADDRLGVVGSFYYNFLDEFEGTEHAEAMHLLTTHEQILEAYVTRRVCDFTSHGAAIVRRSLFDTIGFYDENPFGADSFWLAKVAEYAHHTGGVRLKNIPDFLTLRRLHGSSQTGLLPSIDPRGRRNKYWWYCVARLQEVVARVAENPELDLAYELRHCTCGDFRQRYLDQGVEGESQSVDAGVLSDCLEIARIRFRQKRYVTCIRMLRGVECMDPEAAQSIPNLDLVAALSFYGLGLKDRARDSLRREIANHKNPSARQFHEEAFQRDAEIDVQQWYTAHADAIVLQQPDVAPVGRPVTHSTPSAAPKVTIITACRNAERFLPECLDSILGQTLTDWELFLLDDGSTDGTRQIIKAYAERDARIRPCYFDNQAGPYVRRNYAIERARADFIVIQDADDIMCSTKLDILYGEISRDDTLGMVGGSFRTFLDTYHGPRYSEHNALPLAHDEIIARFKAWRHAMSHGAAIIRKSLFGEIGLYDENPFSSDSFWSAKLATYVEAGRPVRMKNVSECLTLIRMHANNHTKVLSTLDPRNRRNRYRLYCECKLLRIRERIQSLPNVDVAEELRRCKCSDFLTRFKAQIIAWEGEPLDKRVVPEYLESAVRFFNGGYYVSCVNILNNVESFEPAVVDRVMGYDLLRGMALHAVQLKECSRVCLDREIRRHDNAGARAFKREVLDSPHAVEMWQWCNENAGRYDLGLVLSDNPPSSEEVLCGDATAKPQGAL